MKLLQYAVFFLNLCIPDLSESLKEYFENVISEVNSFQLHKYKMLVNIFSPKNSTEESKVLPKHTEIQL